jgi:hypothetical protein
MHACARFRTAWVAPAAHTHAAHMYAAAPCRRVRVRPWPASDLAAGSNDRRDCSSARCRCAYAQLSLVSCPLRASSRCGGFTLPVVVPLHGPGFKNHGCECNAHAHRTPQKKNVVASHEGAKSLCEISMDYYFIYKMYKYYKTTL